MILDIEFLHISHVLHAYSFDNYYTSLRKSRLFASYLRINNFVAIIAVFLKRSNVLAVTHHDAL